MFDPTICIRVKTIRSQVWLCTYCQKNPSFLMRCFDDKDLCLRTDVFRTKNSKVWRYCIFFFLMFYCSVNPFGHIFRDTFNWSRERNWKQIKTIFIRFEIKTMTRPLGHLWHRIVSPSSENSMLRKRTKSACAYIMRLKWTIMPEKYALIMIFFLEIFMVKIPSMPMHKCHNLNSQKLMYKIKGLQ